MSTISMFGVWVKISTILCLCSTAEMNGVVWKEVGRSFTIQCKINSKQDSLDLKKGIDEKETIAVIPHSNPETIMEGMKDRVQTYRAFPNVDILIKNLSIEDTGPYWCVYKRTDTQYNVQSTKGEGSVLLVVTRNSQATSTKLQMTCEQLDLQMIPVYIVVAVAALLIFVLGFIVWIMHKTKSSENRVKPRRVATNNDVYEDMRGTIRR